MENKTNNKASNNVKFCTERGYHSWDKETIDWISNYFGELELHIVCKDCGAKVHLHGIWKLAKPLSTEEAGDVLFSMMRPPTMEE